MTNIQIPIQSTPGSSFDKEGKNIFLEGIFYERIS